MQTCFSFCDFVSVFSEDTIFRLRNADIRDGTSHVLCPCVPCVVGDLMGTSVQGLGALLAMPYGCGEQNMLNFAPAIYIMDYLVASSQVTAEVKDKAVKIMETGMT